MPLSPSGLAKLKGVHPDLVRVVKAVGAATKVSFTILEGLRTLEREAELIKQGASALKDPRDCRHCPVLYPGGNIYGRAVDVAVTFSNGKVNFKDIPGYIELANEFQRQSTKLGIPIRSGAFWKTFKDYGHHELPRSARYP